MTSYTATARREGRWWVVEVDGLGTTQGRNVTEAKDMAADLVSAMTDTAVEDVVTDISFVISETVAHEVEAARHEYQQADELQRDAAK